MTHDKIRFIGTITAGITHELKNVFSIIKESAGLMEDLMVLSQQNPLPHGEKFQRSISRITDQVARGVELSTRLNSFAHTSDESVARVDLNVAAEQAVFLSQRFARLRSVELRSEESPAAVEVTADPLGLQMLLFMSISLILSSAQSGASITLQPRGEGPDRVIALKSSPGEQADSVVSDLTDTDEWQVLKETATTLNAEVAADKDLKGLLLTFSGSVS